VYPLPFTHLDAFAFGAYLSRYSLPKVKSQFFIWLGIIPILGFTSQYLATGSIGLISSLGYPLQMPHAYEFIWGYSLLNYFFAITLQAVAKEGLFNRFLELPFMRYLGKISYGLYVYHFPIVYFVGRIRDWNPAIPEPIAKLLTAIISFAATLLIASLSYRLLEQPMLSLKDRFFAVKRASV
jgi:peptidoglycan/LPS O-acetylase OafA/YrhL